MKNQWLRYAIFSFLGALFLILFSSVFQFLSPYGVNYSGYSMQMQGYGVHSGAYMNTLAMPPVPYSGMMPYSSMMPYPGAALAYPPIIQAVPSATPAMAIPARVVMVPVMAPYNNLMPYGMYGMPSGMIPAVSSFNSLPMTM